MKEGRGTIFLVGFFDPKTNLEVRQMDYSFKAVFSFTYITIKGVKHQKAELEFSVKITPPQQNLINESNNNVNTSNGTGYVNFTIRIPK
ncbi:MAG: hypothetical protein WAL66_02310 [Nitrososphaeraceae archaeon]